ncbi:MAG TPA: nuclear transport factor 2 family protein [Vicinamibacterales bacterium]|nr:nuclear transport factor 2 family protein [Vicinamibacterales bacterium]
MQLISLAAILVLAAGLQPAPADPVAEFRQIAQNLAAAYLRGDRAFVDALLTDDWTSTDYRGRVWTKANVLALFDGPRPPMARAEIDVDRVRLLGDVAIVTGRSLSAGRIDGRDISIAQRFTDIYVRRDGRWRVIASQGTQVQPD